MRQLESAHQKRKLRLSLNKINNMVNHNYLWNLRSCNIHNSYDEKRYYYSQNKNTILFYSILLSIFSITQINHFINNL